MRQLLNIEGFGFKAGFDRQLQHELQGPIDKFIQKPRRRGADPKGEDAAPKDLGEQSEETTEVPESPELSEAGSDKSDDGRARFTETSSRQQTPEGSNAQVLTVIESALGLSPIENSTYTTRLDRIKRTIQHLKRRLRMERSRRQSETLENIETIVQRSADWGYDVAKSGSPRLVPDIERTENGGWRITTEIPRNQSASLNTALRTIGTANANRKQADLNRHVASLEKQIHELTYKINSPSSQTDMAARQQLDLYKDKLRDIDPRNPFAR